jgi:hypothetical protein
MTVPSGYAAVQARVDAAAARCGRPGQVRLVAVSKNQPVEKLLEAFHAGCRLFGENYVQELLAKADALPGVEWHFIGHLQTNKVKAVLPRVSLVHSVDRPGLVAEIDRRSAALDRVQPVLIEVNVGDETSKTGVAIDQLPALAREVVGSESLELRGLMAIPPPVDDPELARPYFRRLRELRDGLEQQLGRPLPELSMGMSADFEVAIEEGATLVRMGTAIFGPRT